MDIHKEDGRSKYLRITFRLRYLKVQTTNNMKIICIIFALLPLALAEDKRFFLADLNLNNHNIMGMFSQAELFNYVNMIVDMVGSDATEQQCEGACVQVMASDLLDTACPFMCNSFQTLVNKFHVQGATAAAKRFLLADLNLGKFLGTFSHDKLSTYVNMVVDMVGSDATGQQCEEACVQVMVSDLLDTACPFLCSSYQTLVNKFHKQSTTVVPAKRFLLADLNLGNNLLGMFSHDQLFTYVNMIVDMVGSEATEQQCEGACVQVMASDLLDTACPFLCSSFQAMVNKFHFQGVIAAPAKRFLLANLNMGNLLDMFSHDQLLQLSSYVNMIVNMVGSDATEQQCETACLDVMLSDLLDTACPFLCSSFQTLVNKFQMQSVTAVPAT